MSDNVRAFRSAGHFPQTQRPVDAARGDHAAVRSHGYTNDSLAVSGKGAYLLAGGDVPELHLAPVVGPARLSADVYQPRAIRRKNHHERRATLGLQAMKQLPACRLPEANVIVAARRCVASRCRQPAAIGGYGNAIYVGSVACQFLQGLTCCQVPNNDARGESAYRKELVSHR